MWSNKKAPIDNNTEYTTNTMDSQRAKLERPEIKSVLEANRAKLSLMAQAAITKGKTALGRTDSGGGLSGQQQPGAIPLDNRPQSRPEPSYNSSLHRNPVYDGESSEGSGASAPLPKYSSQMQTPAVDQTSSRAYGGSSFMPTEAPLPPVGDLFSANPKLPAGIQLAPSIPTLPEWNRSRPYLSGRSLIDIAAGTTSRKPQRSTTASKQPLSKYPSNVQESMLVDDLLYAMCGLDGEYIQACIVQAAEGATIQYEVSKEQVIDSALREMATRMLPICAYVVTTARYVETRSSVYHWGLVGQALAGAMRQILQDWELMVAQLEHQLRSDRLTLQALWYYVQPPMAALRLVATVSAEASAKRLRGASLLNLLHHKCESLMGDAAGHKLMLRLLRAASEPYFAALERWVCDGVLDDPYNELMVREDTTIPSNPSEHGDPGAYWTDKWTVRPLLDSLTGRPVPTTTGSPAVDVPSFLSSVAQEILDAGRYLNLVRSCGKEAPRALPLGTHLEYEEGGKYLVRIREAHAAAASCAMTLLRKDVGLVNGLRCLKRYFLVAQGDVLLHLMDVAEQDLGKMCGRVPLQVLQSHVDTAVRSSTAAADVAAKDLKAAFDHRSVLNMLITITQTAAPTTNPTATATDSPTKRQRLHPVGPVAMTDSEKNTVGRQKLCRESFMLYWQAPWPVSIVASDGLLAQYQMVFRHLFELKWVDRELNRVYQLYQDTTSLANIQRRANRRESLVGAAAVAAIPFQSSMSPQVTACLSKAYLTCQLMTHFFRQYLLYTSFEVLEPLWAAFEARLESASTLDDIVNHHRIFLRKVMKGLLLSRKVVVLRALLGLKDLALQFVRLSSKFLEVDYEAVDEEAEAVVLARHGRIQDRERRQVKDAKLRVMMEKTMTNPEFSTAITDLHKKFETKFGDFMTSLAEAHAQAQTERSDTREELEGLVNLMGRLDFNSYLKDRGVHQVYDMPHIGRDSMTSTTSTVL